MAGGVRPMPPSLGHRAREHHEAFQAEYARIINVFTQEFVREFCVNGAIDWEKLVHFNSGKTAKRT